MVSLEIARTVGTGMYEAARNARWAGVRDHRRRTISRRQFRSSEVPLEGKEPGGVARPLTSVLTRARGSESQWNKNYCVFLFLAPKRPRNFGTDADTLLLWAAGTCAQTRENCEKAGHEWCYSMYCNIWICIFSNWFFKNRAWSKYFVPAQPTRRPRAAGTHFALAHRENFFARRPASYHFADSALAFRVWKLLNKRNSLGRWK